MTNVSFKFPVPPVLMFYSDGSNRLLLLSLNFIMSTEPANTSSSCVMMAATRTRRCIAKTVAKWLKAPPLMRLLLLRQGFVGRRDYPQANFTCPFATKRIHSGVFLQGAAASPSLRQHDDDVKPLCIHSPSSSAWRANAFAFLPPLAR